MSKNEDAEAERVRTERESRRKWKKNKVKVGTGREKKPKEKSESRDRTEIQRSRVFQEEFYLLWVLTESSCWMQEKGCFWVAIVTNGKCFQWDSNLMSLHTRWEFVLWSYCFLWYTRWKLGKDSGILFHFGTQITKVFEYVWNPPHLILRTSPSNW